MNKSDSAKSFVSTLMDKWGTEQQIIAQKDDDWEDRNLAELVENIKKWIERDPSGNDWDYNYRDESNC